GADEHQDFAVIFAELPERAPEVAELERRFLRGRNSVLGHHRFVEWHVTRMVLAPFVVVEVAQDREDPGLEIRSGRELVRSRQGAHCRVVHEIVCPVAVPRQRPRKGAQMRNTLDQGRTELRRCFLDRRLAHSLPMGFALPSGGRPYRAAHFVGFLSRSLSISSRNSFGSGSLMTSENSLLRFRSSQRWSGPRSCFRNWPNLSLIRPSCGRAPP